MKKLAMIGCGGIGRYHLGHFVNFKDIELAGFCDLLIERAEEFVQIAGSGKAYSDFVKCTAHGFDKQRFREFL